MPHLSLNHYLLYFCGCRWLLNSLIDLVFDEIVFDLIYR
jgi:hypothetical protein